MKQGFRFFEGAMKIIKSFISIGLVSLMMSFAVFSQPDAAGVLSGEVFDGLGGAVINAAVTITDSSGKEKITVTDGKGRFQVNGLAAGKYSVRVFAENFETYEASFAVKNSDNQPLKIILKIKAIKEEVDVSNDGRLSAETDNNASGLVLKEDDLAALPDDPEALEAALRALAGGGGGPDGGQIYLDGFEGGRLPSKAAIQEIRINRNPFSAEYDRIGFERIEIITKPGNSKWGGQAFFNFNDDALNARNPFSNNKAVSRDKFYGGSLTGPLVKNKVSFSININNRDASSGSLIRAKIIDSDFNIVDLSQELTASRNRFFVNPRLDYQINKTNALTVRYTFLRDKARNVGGGFLLASQAVDSIVNDHAIQLVETAILNAKTVNETRFQYRSSKEEQIGDNRLPRINVQGAFVGGGTSFGQNFSLIKSWELQNYTTASFGKNNEHSFKFGARVRGRQIKDSSESNFNGTFTFVGFVSPIQNNPYDLDNNGIISSLEQYRAKLLGEANPLYNPAQFSLAAGNPLADITQQDIGLFVTDDWRVRPNLNLYFGLRYENQTNLGDALNFAPRLAFSYAPGAGGGKPAKTILRGGFGVFYSRFDANLSLQSRRFDGTRQRQFIVTGDNSILGQPVFTLNGVANIPTANQLAALVPLTNTPRAIAPDIQAPYIIQGAFSVERQLPKRSTISFSYIAARNFHLFRSRNINAPLCPPGFVCPVNQPAALQALRPDSTRGNVYQYESSGVSTDHRFVISFRTRLNQKFSFFSNYFLAKSRGNAEDFPAYSYDLSSEYGYTSSDVRHTFFFGGSVSLPYGLTASPFIVARSGVPFNITIGSDPNGDSLFSERPTFAQLAAACARNNLAAASWCNISENDFNAVIPRNFGRGPVRFTADLELEKTFAFGKSGDGKSPRAKAGKPYNLTVGVRVNNLFNTNNKNNPIGNINSPLFGQSTNSVGRFGLEGQGSRTIEFQNMFTW
jgi:hypothetical protein